MKILINNSVTEIYNNKLYDYYIFDSNKPIIISEFIKNNKYYTYFVINIDTDTTNNKQINVNRRIPIKLEGSNCNPSP